jgi:hypothetical protein
MKIITWALLASLYLMFFNGIPHGESDGANAAFVYQNINEVIVYDL